jgi:hypothetical protein
MTPLHNFSAALHIVMGLAAIWILLFKLARDYRIDALRNRLFALRDDLFDYASAGNVEFDEPAYFKLRGVINSLIRFAHRLTFTRFLLGFTFTSWKGCGAHGNLLEEWYKAVEVLPAEQQQRLKEIHTSALVIVVRHLISGSPFMVAALFVFSVCSALNGLTRKFLQAFTEKLLPAMNALQVQAIAADTADRQTAARRDLPALVH